MGDVEDQFGQRGPIRSQAIPLLAAIAVLAIAAAGLLVLAKHTPWHTDSDAYFAGMAKAVNDPKAFYANVHRYETHKWLYADLGYAAAAWSVALLLLVAPVNRYGWRVLTRTTTDLRVIIGLPLLACALMVAGMFGDALQHWRRWDMYEGTSRALNYGAIDFAFGMRFGAPLFVAANIAPLIRKPVAGHPLFPIRPIGRGVVVSLLYAPFLFLPGLMLASGPFEAGSWGTSVGAVLAIWLILNARALAMSAKRNPTASPL